MVRLFLRPFSARQLPGGLLFALLCAALAGAGSVEAATLIVTTTADSGAGSLRAAIAAASDGDTIQFDASLNGQSITLTSAELTIDKNITIDGPGADQLAVTKSSGTPEFHIFGVRYTNFVTIKGLTIDGNGTPGAGVQNFSSSVFIDGCVVQGCHGYGGISSICFSQFDPNAFLQVSNSIIRNNYADAAGGGIYNSAFNGGIATLTVINSVVNNNTVGSFGNASGGGILNNTGEMDITNCIVSNNVSGGNGPGGPYGNGGGISNIAGSLMIISDSTISGNSAGIGGGGVYNTAFSTIDSSTVSGNSAIGLNDLEGWGDGAGIYNGSSMTITSSTLSNNNSTRAGGAVGNHGSLTIRHSTLSGNGAIEGSSVANNNGAILHIGHTVLKVSGISPGIFNNSGTVTSDGYNLCSDNGSGLLTATGDQINTEPMLGPLQNNGGPTFTHELLTGSPAIDTGDPNFTPPPSNDQRGDLRVFNGRIDIGSLEVQPVTPTPTPTPTATATATPTATATATVAPSPTPTATATVAPSPTPTATATVAPSATPTPTSSPTPAAQPINLSTRMRVQTGDNVGIGGFIITGTAPKHVLLRAIGPSLTQSGIPDALADPVLELHGPGSFVTITNDNWRDDPVQEAAIIADGIPPTNDLESAIDATLNPGAYTAVVRGKNNTSGVALVEVYDLSQAVPAKLANISTRALVSTGNDIVIAGFILGNHNGGDRVVVRGIGPSLTAAGVPNALANPTLELRDSNGALLVANNNWQDDPAQAAELTAAGLAPTNPLESGLAATLPPGLYTALLAGLNNGTGVGVVEVYDLGL